MLSKKNIVKPIFNRMAYSALRNIRLSRGAKRTGQVNIPVIYLGSVQILCPVGDGICGSVEEIFQNCGIKMKNNSLPKRTLSVRNGAFHLSEEDDEGQEVTKVIYNFRRIIYCGVDGKRPKLFAFNYHHGSDDGRGVYLTHAFKCESRKAAKTLASVVAQHFKSVKSDGEQVFDKGSFSQLVEKQIDSDDKQDDTRDDIELENMAKQRKARRFLFH